jgi:ATP-dependent protease ClpP protease subunit
MMFFNYLTWHPKIKHIRLEIDSYGGAMWGMKSIIGFMDEFKANGGTIETVVRAKAFSAGFAIFLNGTKGQRYVSNTAHLMWHEVLSAKLFSIETPASSEDEALMLRHFQDTMNAWIASKSKLTKKQVDEMVHKKELWCNGKEAVKKYGFADKLIQ